MAEKARRHPGRAAFGDLVRSSREEAELTQEELAEKTGISPRTIRYWEQGESSPRRITVKQLIKGLGVDPRTRDALLTAAARAADPVTAQPPPDVPAEGIPDAPAAAPPGPTARRPRHWSPSAWPRRVRAATALVGLVVLVGAVVAGQHLLDGDDPTTDAPGSVGPPSDGAAGLVDGVRAAQIGCNRSGAVVESALVHAADGAVLGTVELLYSPCRGGSAWARFDNGRDLDTAPPSSITVRVTRRPDGSTYTGEGHHRHGSVSTAMVQLPAAACAQADAAVTVAGLPQVAASTSCRTGP